MATLTTVTKQAISWDAPPPEETSGVAYELLIGASWKLDVGSGYNLTIQPSTVAIQFTNVSKNTPTHIWPSESQYVALDIGSGYNLLINSEDKLLIQGVGTGVTDWTGVSKTSTSTY